MSHEASTVVLNKDGHAVIYTGDDDCFDDAHRLATEAKFDPANPAFGKDMLDKGTLSVARCDADDLMTWLPLAHGTAGLTAEAGGLPIRPMWCAKLVSPLTFWASPRRRSKLFGLNGNDTLNGDVGNDTLDDGPGD